MAKFYVRRCRIMMRIICVVLLFLSICGNALADRQKVGDWLVDVGENYTEAFTSNDSGSTFGLFCLSESCSFYFDVNTRCEDDEQTFVLINAESGAAYVNVKCVIFHTEKVVRYLNVAQDIAIANSITQGNIIGIAIPMISGNFKVVRFSLNGAMVATKKAFDKSKTLRKTGSSTGRDKLL